MVDLGSLVRWHLALVENDLRMYSELYVLICCERRMVVIFEISLLFIRFGLGRLIIERTIRLAKSAIDECIRMLAVPVLTGVFG